MTVPKRFSILRLMGWVLKVFAWIVLVIFILLGIFIAVAAGGTGSQLLGNLLPQLGGITDLGGTAGGGVVLGIGVLLIGIIYFLVLYASGESFHLQLALEENTRLTAALLLRMHQESQQETRPGYGSTGFESERFER